MKASHVLYAFATFLVVAAVVAVFLAPEGANVTTALVVPGVFALIAYLTGLVASGRYGEPIRAKGRVAGIVVTFVFAALAAWRAVAASGVPEKAYLRNLLWALAVAGLAAGLALLRTPRPGARS